LIARAVWKPKPFPAVGRRRADGIPCCEAPAARELFLALSAQPERSHEIHFQ
jgi:hypothetical protein